jgi:hypothetical protein
VRVVLVVAQHIEQVLEDLEPHSTPESVSRSCSHVLHMAMSPQSIAPLLRPRQSAGMPVDPGPHNPQSGPHLDQS